MKIINKVYNQDCIKGMKEIKDNQIDLIITDPPFAIKFDGKKKANYNRDSKLVLDGYNEVPEDEYRPLISNFLVQSERILKDSGSIYIFSGFNHLHIIQDLLLSLGLELLNHVIWKYQFGVVTKKKYVTSHWTCLFAVKKEGKHKFYPNCRFEDEEKFDTGRSKRYKDMEDVWEIKREYWKGEIKTPTKLPGEIVEKILQYSSVKKDIVLDPFMGSGQVPLYAKKLKRRYCGFELAPNLFKFAKKRIDNSTFNSK